MAADTHGYTHVFPYQELTRYLDCSDKCFRFNVATHFKTQHDQSSDEEDLDIDHEGDPNDLDALSLAEHMNVSHSTVNYFTVTNAISRGCISNALKPCRTFVTSTTAFHITNKHSLLTSINKATTLFGQATLLCSSGSSSAQGTLTISLLMSSVSMLCLSREVRATSIQEQGCICSDG
ncbi:hypothetical protein L210DRAFT_865362 [Boletus edulis BED1]|uniref:DUF6830 domain-containing protein n=1 Tax=Boletus edulis BED1 TaxID=1328754 RepID=A0AAD4GEE4_BOLED|nr:hypothetical protein L210DRAFT_865362 [Boletus edulis BED1]